MTKHRTYVTFVCVAGAWLRLSRVGPLRGPLRLCGESGPTPVTCTKVQSARTNVQFFLPPHADILSANRAAEKNSNRIAGFKTLAPQVEQEKGVDIEVPAVSGVVTTKKNSWDGLPEEEKKAFALVS